MVRYTIGKSGNEDNHEDNTDPDEILENKETEEPTNETAAVENIDTTEATESPGNTSAENEANKQDDSPQSPKSKEEQNESVDKCDSPKSQEEKDSQMKEDTTKTKPRGEGYIEMDRMSRFEKLLLDCKNRQIEIESKTALLEECLGKSMQVMMRKIDIVLEYQQRSLPPPPAQNFPQPRWAFPAPLSLLQAAERGDTETLMRLLSAESQSWEVQLHQRDAHGDTALHIAAARGYARVVQLLLMVGACVSTPGRFLRTPLHCAAANGHLQIVRRLLDAGVAVDAKDSDGATALAAAAMSGRVQVVSVLLKKGARLDVVDEKGLSPIFLATSGGHANVVRLLLEKGVSTDVEGKTLLIHAAKADQWSVVKLLMERGVSPEHSGNIEDGLLAMAAKAGQGDVVRELLLKGAASDAEQVECALRLAKSASVVWALAEAAAKQMRGSAGQWGLLYAAEAGHTDAVKAFLEAGVDIKARDARGITTLHIAAWNGHSEVARELLVRGADVQAQDGNGDTPLHRAAAGDQLLCIRILLEAGAKRDTVNKKGKTPKDVAVSEVGRRVVDGEGLFYGYTLNNTGNSFSFGSVIPSGPIYLNNLNQSNAPTAGVLFGTGCLSANSNNSNLNLANNGQSNAGVGSTGFGNPAQSFNNGNSGSFSFGVGQINTQQGKAFGMPAQSVGNETNTASSFGCGQISQGSSSGLFGKSQSGISMKEVSPSLFGKVTTQSSASPSVFGQANTQSSASQFAFGQATTQSSASSSVSGQATAQNIGLFGSLNQSLGSQNKKSLPNSIQKNTTTFGGIGQIVEKEMNDSTPCSSNTKTVPIGSVGGTPVVSGFNIPVDNSHQINGGNILGISSQLANGFIGAIASENSSPLNTSIFGTPAKETVNFPSNNFDQSIMSTCSNIFGKADQSVNNETSKSAPINTFQIKKLSGYNINRNANESESDKVNCKLDREEQNKSF